MRKCLFLCAAIILNTFLFALDDPFIRVESTETVIGNDDFRAMQKSFTGVDGEVNEAKMKYYRKEHDVELSEYHIKKYLVTYEEFQNFLNETHYRTLYEKERKSSYMSQLKIPGHPVKRISMIDAIAYCQWYSDKNGKTFRLPTSAEWEYAALCGEKKIFPWGNEGKILPSTNIESIVGREDFNVDQIEEDVSSIGMSNLMGGVEYTLDCYHERFYENSPSVNPLCLIPYNADCVMRGIKEYNNLDDDVYGLYDLTWNSVADYNGYSYFRIVQSDDTVFNKGTEDEALYCTELGKASTVTAFKHPQSSDTGSSYEVCSDLFILFRSKDGQFYRCFFQVKEKDMIFGGITKKWKFGWIDKNEIEIIPQKWYER